MKNIIVNLRGTNGSGKTTVAKEVLRKSKAEPVDFWPNTRNPKPKAYLGDWKGTPIHILGSYATVCGGMDTVTDINLAADLIEEYAHKPGILFYEGLFISHCLGTVAARLLPFRSIVHMAYLDTPLAVSLARVHARRAERGVVKPFKEQNVIDDFQRVNEWNFAKAKRDGWNAFYIDHTKAQSAVEKLLNKGVVK